MTLKKKRKICEKHVIGTNIFHIFTRPENNSYCMKELPPSKVKWSATRMQNMLGKNTFGNT